MQWKDEGIILSLHPFGERSLIVTLFTKTHGKHSGLVYKSRKNNSFLQPGNIISIEWNARLPEQLGNYKCEPLVSTTALIIHKPQPLLALISMLQLLKACLGEHDPHPTLYKECLQLLDDLLTTIWLEKYIKWELGLLREMGFGLSLKQCAVTGSTENLAYVSPKTGNAATLDTGLPYANKLLKLPTFIYTENKADNKELIDGLSLTGYFIENKLMFLDEKRYRARKRLVASIL
jgi:DNA repair protein RecO (recombination protein O)